MKIVKLGGSIITQKSKSKRLRRDVLERLCAEIASSNEHVIVVHGAGSFGHILAKRYGLQSGLDPKSLDEQVIGLSMVQRDMRELNLAVLRALLRSGLRPVSIPPGVAVRCDNKSISSMPTKLFEDYLELGFTPVSFGDVVLDSKLGFCVCSGDQIIERLCSEMQVSQVIFVTDVDGVYTKPPGTPGSKLIPKMTSRGSHDMSCGRSNAPDVTGGMAAKVRVAKAIAKLAVPCLIMNGDPKGRLLKALKGGRIICTEIRGGER